MPSVTPRTNKRERLIAKAQWWAGWCVDEDHIELHVLLLDIANQMKKDRPNG